MRSKSINEIITRCPCWAGPNNSGVFSYFPQCRGLRPGVIFRKCESIKLPAPASPNPDVSTAYDRRHHHDITLADRGGDGPETSPPPVLPLYRPRSPPQLACHHRISPSCRLVLPFLPGIEFFPLDSRLPSFFAYFQLLLSSPASAVDPIITHLHLGFDYKSSSVIFFQRSSVILADSLLFAGAYLVSRRKPGPARWTLWMLIVWSPMLIIADHVHFQYKGFLLGLLLLSLWFFGEGRDLAGGILFAVLLCFKHLFTVAAPVYFVYLLRRCFVGKGGFIRGFR